jgi:hypothetical protein
VSIATRQQLAQLHEATQFAIHCTEPPFKVFLHERKGAAFPLTDDNAIATVLELLELRHRDQIRTQEAAAAQWRALRAEFQDWRVS